MIVVPCEQGSAEWHAARGTIPTASCFDKLLTPKTLKPSASADKYLAELLSAWLFGPPDDGNLGGFVARGNELEDEAAQDFAFRHGVTVERAPFVMRDDRMAGASPDYLVVDDALLETKCPSAAVHIGYLLGGLDLEGAYRLQLQGQLLITERRVVTICAYHPTMPPVEVEVERDPVVIDALGEALDLFADRLRDGRQRLLDMGLVPWSGEA